MRLFLIPFPIKKQQTEVEMRRGQIGLTIHVGNVPLAETSARLIRDHHNSNMTIEVTGGTLKVTSAPEQVCHLKGFERHAKGKNFKTERHGTWPKLIKR